MSFVIGKGRTARMVYPTRSNILASVQRAAVFESSDAVAFNTGVAVGFDLPLMEALLSGPAFFTRTGDDIELESGLYSICARIVTSSGQNTITLNLLFNGGLNVIPATADAITNGFLNDMSLYGAVLNPGSLNSLAMKATGANGNITFRQLSIVKHT
jgi:hypothetical protein